VKENLTLNLLITKPLTIEYYTIKKKKPLKNTLLLDIISDQLKHWIWPSFI